MSNNLIKGIIYIILLSSVLALFFFYQLYSFHEKDKVLSLKMPTLTGYTSKSSYLKGEKIKLFVHSRNDFKVTIFRVSDSLVKIGIDKVFKKTEQVTLYSLRYGHDWKKPVELNSDSLKAGYYLAHLSYLDQKNIGYSIPLVINEEKCYEVAIVANTNTWQAYNNYGGKSNYVDNITPKYIQIVYKFLGRIDERMRPYTFLPYNRPYNHPINYLPLDSFNFELNCKISSEFNLVRFLSRKNIDFNVVTDIDFETNSRLTNAKTIIFHNHSEYWSIASIGRLKSYIEEGKNIIFLSGNNIYRNVEYIDKNRLQIIKQHYENAEITPIIGTFYSESGTPESSSYSVINNKHWVFSNTKLAFGDTFGINASGIETDRLSHFSEGFTLLAEGNNTHGPAHMVIKEFENKGNFLFNASSISFSRSLNKDTHVDEIISNLLIKAKKTKHMYCKFD